MIIEQYWAGIARRLQIESGTIHSLIPHAGTKGTENELALTRILEKLVPPTVGVGSGIIFDHTGQTSAQTDVVLYDKGAQPQLLAQTNQVMFPVETVKMAIEVKTALSGNDIRVDFADKKAKLDSLTVLPGFNRPAFSLFAYSFADSDFGRAEDILSVDAPGRPELACVITPGFFVEGERIGFVPLCTSGATDDLDQHFVRPVNGNKASTLIGGVHYPVYMLGKYRGEQFVGDPGRALLLYCMSLLRLLDDAGLYSWIRKYTRANTDALQPVPSRASS